MNSNTRYVTFHTLALLMNQIRRSFMFNEFPEFNPQNIQSEQGLSLHFYKGNFIGIETPWGFFNYKAIFQKIDQQNSSIPLLMAEVLADFTFSFAENNSYQFWNVEEHNHLSVPLYIPYSNRADYRPSDQIQAEYVQYLQQLIRNESKDHYQIAICKQPASEDLFQYRSELAKVVFIKAEDLYTLSIAGIHVTASIGDIVLI